MSSDPIIGGDNNTYANMFSYMGFPLSRELSADIDAVVMGVPYDLATTGRSGTRYGPNGVRQASAILRWEKARWPWQFELEDRLNVIDYGDIAFTDGNHKEMETLITEAAEQILCSGKTLLTFGGDHYITLPLLRAAHKAHGELALVHFDAHADADDDGEYNHGTMMFYAPQEGLVNTDHSIQVGIRTQYPYDSHRYAVIHGPQANNLSAQEIAQQIKDRVGDKKVYLTFDIDCLDPAFAPGTGTPVSGGISTDKAMQIIRLLSDLDVVAMDVVEVAPGYDSGDITSLAGATLALEMLYLVASRKSL